MADDTQPLGENEIVVDPQGNTNADSTPTETESTPEETQVETPSVEVPAEEAEKE